MLWECLLSINLILIILYKWYTWKYDYWTKKGVPQVEPTFPFGNLGNVIKMKKTIGDAYTEMYWMFKNEPFFGFYKLRNPVLMVRDPELIKEVLVTKFTCFDGNDYYVDPDVDPVLGLNPFNCRGERWKMIRGLITPGLTGAKIKSSMSNMKSVSNEMVSFLLDNEGSFIQAFDVAMSFTTDVISHYGYSLKTNSFKDENSEFRKMSANMFCGGFKGNAATLFAFYAPQLGSLFKWKILSNEVTDYFTRIIKETCEYRIENNLMIDDFLQTLINANSEGIKENGKPVFSYKEMAGHCMTFSLDGFETAALLITYLFFELSLDQDVQDKLRDHILAKIDSLDDINYEKLHSIEYLEWAIYECLRKHSPGTMMARKCNKGTRLESGGKCVDIKAGQAVVLPLLAVMNDPAHFPEPDLFKPERFEPPINHHPYSHFPFGGGPRACPGKQLAITMVKTALVSVLIHFRILPKDPSFTKIEEDPMYSFFHNSKQPIYVSFNKL